MFKLTILPKIHQMFHTCMQTESNQEVPQNDFQHTAKYSKTACKLMCVRQMHGLLIQYRQKYQSP